jgi:hypothetical protein
LNKHDVDWPGFLGGRATYDTPFYSGGGSEWRSGNTKGTYDSKQQVCIEDMRCSGRTEINYIAQGMWAARTGESKPTSELIVRGWKFVEYGETEVSEDTLYWLNYGYDHYLRWLERQKTGDNKQ